jgi:hypothetical protein
LTGKLFGEEEMIVPLVVQRSMARSSSEVKNGLFFIAHGFHLEDSSYIEAKRPFPASVNYTAFGQMKTNRLGAEVFCLRRPFSALFGGLSRSHPHSRYQPVPETTRQSSYYFLDTAGNTGLYIPVIMNLIFRSAASTSRTICRSRFQSSTLPHLYLRQASTMQHNVPKLNDPSLLKTNVAYVNGEWVKAKSGKTFEVTGKIITISALCQSWADVYSPLDPSSGKVISTAPEFDAADTQLAIDAAAAAFPSFRTTTGRQRSKLLRKWYDLMVWTQGIFRGV